MNSLVSYDNAVKTIKTAILQGQYEAAKDVNRVQLVLYFAIGKYLSQHTRNRSWGEGALTAISEQLRKELPGLRGFSETQMKDMRRFYEAWEILDINSTVATVELLTTDNEIDIFHAMQVSNVAEFPVEDFFKVPFTHHSIIIGGTKDVRERYYYIHRTAEEHLGIRKLRQLIKEDVYKSQGYMPSNFTRTINDPIEARRAVEMFKDEYLLDFINVEEIGQRESIDVDERVVEQKIVQNIKNFIMTFGKDFTFVGNQYHLEVFELEQYPDLLFFNRELNCLVCVELKKGNFKPSYLGQLTTYLRILDDTVKKKHENPTIGIILCKDFNRDFVEYIIQDYHKPMGVARYSTTADMPEQFQRVLPNIEELRKVLAK